MIETIGHLHQAGLAAPVCVAVHAVFARTAFEDLRAAGARVIVSCDTVRHPSNRISLAPVIAASLHTFVPAGAARIGPLDRTLRVSGGVLLIVLAATEAVGRWGYIGVVPLLTGVAGTCPLYSLFGLSTWARARR